LLGWCWGCDLLIVVVLLRVLLAVQGLLTLLLSAELLLDVVATAGVIDVGVDVAGFRHQA